MTTLTIDQLRAYLERREREEQQMVERSAMRPGWGAYRTSIARRDLCRELLMVIEKGELPE